ncbi:MAG: hypothetical protein M1144_02805 [Candidatus Thermoplasmatota archaeon]|nr:hypothetical protein [Candidatus Thermoplasmatota archaeon]MCL5984313.1 hypothetical protein [Candidatus Thermoplasmatota archaeon]
MEFYPLIRGAFAALAMVTVAIAGLTYLQHGNFLYVVAGLVTGAVLYLVTEWAMPIGGLDEGKDLENSDDPDQRHNKKWEGR